MGVGLGDDPTKERSPLKNSSYSHSGGLDQPPPFLAVVTRGPSPTSLVKGPGPLQAGTEKGGPKVLCEHTFVTAQGGARTQFRRALERRNLLGAEMALREMGQVTLLEALDYLALLAELRPEKLEAAAVRWHGRLELEASILTLPESQLALAALANLTSGQEAIDVLRRLVRRAQPTVIPQVP